MRLDVTEIVSCGSAMLGVVSGVASVFRSSMTLGIAAFVLVVAGACGELYVVLRANRSSGPET
jgi:hypothetical protein